MSSTQEIRVPLTPQSRFPSSRTPQGQFHNQSQVSVTPQSQLPPSRVPMTPVRGGGGPPRQVRHPSMSMTQQARTATAPLLTSFGPQVRPRGAVPVPSPGHAPLQGIPSVPGRANAATQRWLSGPNPAMLAAFRSPPADTVADEELWAEYDRD